MCHIIPASSTAAEVWHLVQVVDFGPRHCCTVSEHLGTSTQEQDGFTGSGVEACVLPLRYLFPQQRATRILPVT